MNAQFDADCDRRLYARTVRARNLADALLARSANVKHSDPLLSNEMFWQADAILANADRGWEVSTRYDAEQRAKYGLAGKES
jgi:hypothetical protein